jgi:Flp pilus assembly protein TadD
MYAQLPPNLDGGVGQLLRYCSKFQNSGDLVTAAGLCERAHRMDPTNPAPLMQLADILVAMKQPQQAITAYHTIIATAPDNTDAHYALGKLYIGLGQYDLAAAAFQAALRSKTDDPRIYNALGVAHGLVGANASALQAFEAGLAVGPKHISLRNNFGLSLVLNGRHEEGIKVLEEVAKDPNANETSQRNLQLAYGMVTAADADRAITKAEAAEGGAERASVVAEATAQPDAIVQAAPVASGDEQLAPKAPIALIQEAEREQALQGSGELETPIEVTVFDSPAPTHEPRNPDWRSPRRMQTARVASGDLEDALADPGAPSARMGEYLSADASFEETPAEASEPAAPAAEVAALQAIAPSLPDVDIRAGYAVQLASYRSEGRAMRGWTELRSAAPELLETIEPVIRRADLGQDVGTYYRLRTAPVTKGEAETLCTELKSRGIDCLVIKEAPANSDAETRAG